MSQKRAGRRAGATVALVVLVLWPLGALAAERTTSDLVLVDQATVIDEDLYAAGNRVLILGRVVGDLVVTAFEDVTIAGTVTGDVIGLAGSVVVTDTGTVGESVRVITPQLRVEGTVEGDILGLTWGTTVDGIVARDVLVWSFGAGGSGRIGGDLEGRMRSLDLAGTIDGNVDVTINNLTVAEGAVIGGNLGYRSPAPFPHAEIAEVGGIVVHRTPLAPNVRLRALMVMAKLLIGLLVAIVGLMVMWAMPAATDRAVARVRSSWWQAWLRGVAVCLAPIAVGALAVLLLGVAPASAAFPLLAVLIPAWLATTGVVLALGFAASAAVYPWLGRWQSPERSTVRAFLIATGLVMLLSLIPWAVLVVVLLILPIGVGGWLGDAPGGERTAAVRPRSPIG